jgi:hypothetical protein
MRFALPPPLRGLVLAPLLLVACQPDDPASGDHGSAASTPQAQGIADAPSAGAGAADPGAPEQRAAAPTAGVPEQRAAVPAASAPEPACVYAADPGALCPAFAHPCTKPGSAEDVACGYNPDNGLPGGAYCSTACGTCPYCRMRGVVGQPCEVDVEGSCYPGLACVGGVCENLTTDGGICFNCPDPG